SSNDSAREKSPLMRINCRFLAVVIVTLSGFWPSGLVAAQLHRGTPGLGDVKPDLALLRETLRASGVTDPGRSLAYETSFLELMSALQREVGLTHSAYRRARKLHLALHKST